MRQNLRYFLERPYEYYLILSGDQLYRMDYGDLLQAHLQTGAEITLGTTPVDRAAASGFGIMHYRLAFGRRPDDADVRRDQKTQLGGPDCG